MNKLSIRRTEGITQDSLQNNEHNIWLGVSLGSKWFSRENVTDLISLALRITKESLLLWVPGRLEAVNIRYIEKLNRAQALRKAFRLEKEKIEMIEGIIKTSFPEHINKIQVATYDQTLTPRIVLLRDILYRDFSREGKLYQRTCEIAEEILALRKRKRNKERVESTALYILQEIPFFIDGVRMINSTSLHSVVLYPGWGKLDNLAVDIRNSSDFSSLRAKMNLESSIGIVEVVNS